MRPVAQIWLPDRSCEVVEACIEKEDDLILRGGLCLCPEALKHEASLRGPMAVREERRMIGGHMCPQRLQHVEVVLRNGIDPFRLTWILERLCAVVYLVDDTVCIENAAVLASLPPYCNGCDRFRHTHSVTALSLIYAGDSASSQASWRMDRTHTARIDY